MNKMNKKSFIAFLVITSLYTFFIWSNSIMTADISGMESEGVRAFINNILKDLGFTFQLTSHITRKLAHFSEFTLLGFLSTLTIGKHRKLKIIDGFLSSVICLIVSVIDECIQIFTPGRACQFTDVLIDFSGVICGILLFFILHKILILYKERGNGNGKNSSEK